MSGKRPGRPMQAFAPEGAAAIGRPLGWTRQQMADRLAQEFRDGWLVNLGIGIPTLCSNTDLGDREVTYHAENGVIGYGPVLPAGEEDLHLVNAGGQNVSLRPGAAIVHHADSFGLIRGGRIDVTVMGAYEVSAGGDFANWKLAGAPGGKNGGTIGGAMDLAVGARRVFIMLEHTTRAGEPRLVRHCALPVTAHDVVTLVATNYGLFAPNGEGFTVRELAPGISLEAACAATGAPLEQAAAGPDGPGA